MRVQYSYNIGDIVEVKPYSLFSNPTPIEWNDDPYGYGKDYQPHSKFTFQQSLDLFAQYDPIYVNYYLTAIAPDGQLTADLVSYASRVGTRVEIAEFPWISGFAGWVDKDGQEVSAGSYTYLTSTVDLFMSCEFEYSLRFNGNGGTGSMQSLSAVEHVYVDRSTHQAVKIDATVSLPNSDFQNRDLRFRAWQIDYQMHYVGNQYVLQHDATAYALWASPTQYMLNVRCALVNDAMVFRHFMLKVNGIIGDGKMARFSKLCFVDQSTGQSLAFPSTATVKTFNIASFSDRCGPENGIDGSTQTMVSLNATYWPCAIAYDLGAPILDVSKYSHMQIWTTSNSAAFSYLNMNDFELYVSNNGEDWFLADSYSGPVNTGSRQILYESQDIFVSSVESDVWDDPTADDFTLVGYAKGNGGCVDTGYVPTVNTKLAIEMKSDSQYTGYVYVGFYAGDDSKDFRYFCTDANATYFDISGKRYKWAGSPSTTDFHTVICSKDGISIDGQSKGSGTGSIDEISNNSIYVFGIPGHEVNFILKRLQIYESDQLKMDFVPAIDKASKSCLVDILSKTKYYSANGKDIYCSNDSGQQFCTVTFNANGGTCSERSRQIRVGTAIGELPQAEKVDWFYVGWYTSASGGTQVTKDTVFSSNATIYARYADVDTRTYVKYTDGSSQYFQIVGQLDYNSISNRIRTSIQHVSIGSSVTSIGNDAFRNCSGLTSVTIPNSVTSIGSHAFDNCSGLTSVTISDLVTSIGYKAFYNCSSLTSVTITANGGNAQNAKQLMIDAGVSPDIEWIIQSK